MISKKIDSNSSEFHKCCFCYFMDTDSLIDGFSMAKKGYCKKFDKYVPSCSEACESYKYFFEEVSKCL